jgi:hypothetical protein
VNRVELAEFGIVIGFCNNSDKCSSDDSVIINVYTRKAVCSHHGNSDYKCIIAVSLSL